MEENLERMREQIVQLEAQISDLRYKLGLTEVDEMYEQAKAG